jgi:hypothetical protein
MLIILLEYTCNIVVHIHSKYTFINLNTIFHRIQKIYLCIFIGLQLNWSHLQLMGNKNFFWDENQTKCCSHGRMNTKIVAN